jgi:hypothetical protein
MTWRAAQRGTLLTALALALLGAALFPAVSSATFGIEPGSVEIRALDSSDNPDNRAGAHPDHVDVSFKIHTTGDGTSARDLRFEFAPGLTGSPIATKTCSRVVFEFEECPKDTQVGIFSAAFFGGESFDEPIWNITPAPGQLAALGFKPFWETELEMSIRPKDFGLDISTDDMPQLPFDEGQVELWGVPADHNGSPPSERAAFLTTPTECGPLKFKLVTRSWEVGSQLLSEEAESEPFTGCESLPFEPSLGLQLSSSKPDSPTGARIDLNLAEHNGPDEQVSADLKDVKVDLPPGLTVSPGGVEGREVCSDEQFGLGKESPVSCPFHSRVGSVEVSTPQLSSNLIGSIFLGHEQPGERFRLFVAASAPGIDYKAVAKLIPDPQTGQLSTVFNGLPQFSVGRISLNFDSGPRALLATPLSCGPATARATFVPYSGGEPVEDSTSVNIGGASCGALPPFSPGLVAGSTDLAAGRSTAFALTLSREEGEQLPGKFTTTFPPGLSANLTAVQLCAAAAAEAGHCSDASKIGSAVGEVGSGPSPAKVPGAVYLTEAYKGAPFGLSIVFRAAIGPFDLGTLNVRATLGIDPHTGQVTIEHLLPSVFEGVPLRFRTIGIDLTRAGFLVNPTSCEPEQLTSTVFSVDHRAVPVSDPFNVTGCDALGFSPKFSVALDQRGRRADNPELSFAVKVPKEQANLKRFKVKFPHVLKFHNAGLKEICQRADATEGRCRPGSRVGTAAAVSPLLSEPLSGPVYVVQPDGGGFPDLWSNVEGEGVKLQLRSESSGKHGNLVTEMVDIPDLPLASFTMRVNGGGKKGALFSINGNPCSSPGALATPVELEGHDNADRVMSVQMKAGCSKSGRKQRISGRGRVPNGSK